MTACGGHLSMAQSGRLINSSAICTQVLHPHFASSKTACFVLLEGVRARISSGGQHMTAQNGAAIILQILVWEKAARL